MTDTTRLYGVSSGNGNDGVSHMFADYYCRTNDPYKLAELAALSTFKAGAGRKWAAEHMELDGEAEYTITAMFLNPPCDSTPDGEYPDMTKCTACGYVAAADTIDACPECGGDDFEDDSENTEDGRNWSEGNGAWCIIEVFPASEDETRDRPIYDSLADCFSSDLTVAA